MELQSRSDTLDELARHAQRLIARGHHLHAEKLLRRLAANKVPSAFAALGRIMRFGLGAVRPDPDAAYRWFVEGDALRDLDSTVELARCAGTGTGCEKDEERGFALAKAAADRGSVQGAMIVAQCLLDGVGTEKNCLAALPYLEKLVDESIPDLLYALGYILMIDEDGYPRDPQRAAELFKRAAAAGSDEACYALASIAHHAGNETEAADWMAFLHAMIPDSEVDAYFAEQPDDELTRLYFAVRESELDDKRD